VRASMKSVAANESTCAATCERNGDGSKRSIPLTGERPSCRPDQKASRPMPVGGDHADAGDPDASLGARAHAARSARFLNVARVRPAMGRRRGGR
jgi:hypothetical protein